MAIPQPELEALLRSAFPDADIAVCDLVGDSDHYRAEIAAHEFCGLPMVRQHQLVYAALGDLVGGRLHALSLITKCKL